MRFRFSGIVMFMAIVAMVSAQSEREAYVWKYAQIAVDEMKSTGIPASITLAQGILESRSGLSELSAKSNNHFGIKCHKEWRGPSVSHDDDAKGECFRKYDNAEKSFKDHSAFLSTRKRYRGLFQLNRTDYKGWAKGLKKAGYATDPQYAHRLIKIIEEEELYTFDMMQPEDVGLFVAQLKRGHGNYTEPIRTAEKPQLQKPKDDNTIRVVEIKRGPAGMPEPTVASLEDRKVFITNHIKSAQTFYGDSPSSLALFYGVSIKRLKKYNEWNEYRNEFKPGMTVYLQPKKSRARDKRLTMHTVQAGETMYTIAQKYGIKTASLYKMNLLTAPDQPAEGEIIYLRKKRKTVPSIRRKALKLNAPAETAKRPNPLVEVQKQEDKKKIDALQPPVKATVPAALNTPKPVPPKEERGKLLESGSGAEVKKVSEEYHEGRAIIYDPPPPVNQKPPPTYRPPTVSSPDLSTENITKTQSSTSPQAAPVKHHKVVRGDTLYGLARKYGITVTNIKAWNNLTSNTIKVGQRLVVKK